MKTRLISGSCYVAILIAFYCLKIFVHDFFFDWFLYAVSLLGTYEMLRALKGKMTSMQRCVTFAFAMVALPAVALAEEFAYMGMLVMGATFFFFALAILCLLVVRYTETTLEGTGLALLSGIYPTMLLCLLSLVNHAVAPIELDKFAFDSRLLILLVFVIAPISDSMAYVFGVSLKKYFPKKMTPILSPNKTVIGGIGGLVGGVLGAAILYFAYNGICGSFDQMYIWLPVYLVIGLVGAIATAFGDLVESAIKRKVGIKDMGNIMPGHGGALDRIDSVLFAAIVVYGAFMMIGLFV
jgi:phosphatidate cytidylyltransferase